MVTSGDGHATGMTPPTLHETRELEAWPCQSVCVWQPSGQRWYDQTAGELDVFGCVGCGSEWVRTEAWTPIDADGRVPEPVAAERARGGRR